MSLIPEVVQPGIFHRQPPLRHGPDYYQSYLRLLSRLACFKLDLAPLILLICSELVRGLRSGLVSFFGRASTMVGWT